jgi:hypothetical protein
MKIAFAPYTKPALATLSAGAHHYRLLARADEVIE